jgi:hypothetical protein
MRAIGTRVITTLLGMLELSAVRSEYSQVSTPGRPAGMLLQRYDRAFLLRKMVPTAAWKPFRSRMQTCVATGVRDCTGFCLR